MSTKQISIAGQVITLSTPYAEGHVLTAAEAKSLNQTRCENIGNNFRKEMKNALDAGSSDALAKVIGDIEAYDKTYVFSMTQARTPTDPIEAEAMRIAKEFVLGKIKEAGFPTLKAYIASAPDKQAKYDANIEKVSVSDDTLKLAKAAVAAKGKAKNMQTDMDV